MMNHPLLLSFFIVAVFCIFYASTNPVESNNEGIFSLSNSSINQDLHDTCSQTKLCSPGVLLPVWEPQDVGWATKAFRALVYLAIMLYLFLGVSIVSDRFMAAIEVITSQEREVKLKKATGEPYTVLIRVWNETVSNLTLMALGSSAPEILLSVIEIFGNHFEAGDLGPSTIVGSAAFNLFVIIAVCIYVIPEGENRKVHRIDVFWVTVCWSTFAYIWLYLILSVFSPNVVEVWEGFMTFLFFPLTVLSAYVANRYTANFGQRILKTPAASFIRRATPARFGSTKKTSANIENGEEFRVNLMGNRKLSETDNVVMDDHKKRFLEIFKELRTEQPDLSIQELEKLATEKIVKETPKSRAFYRIQATHKMMGAGDLTVKTKKAIRKKSNELVNNLMPEKPKLVTVEFDPANYMCLENVGTMELKVKCDRGSLQVPTKVMVHYKTYPDSAQEDQDFIPAEGELVFKPSETEKTIEIGIVDNEVYEEDEQFFVRLSRVRAVCFMNEQQSIKAVLGPASEATVLIIDDDHGGAFSFETEVFKVSESQSLLILKVRRHRGARGRVILPYKVTDGLAKNGSDYIAEDGQIIFDDGETVGHIEIEIINDDEYEKEEDFYVEIEEPKWETDLGPGENGADGRPVLGAHTRCKVVIIEDKAFKGFIDKVVANANVSFMVGTSSWKQQFSEALQVEDLDGDGVLSPKEKILHFICLPWKLIFALIPPTDYANGWLCFVVAIFGIGMLTAVIGDVASMFGCTIGLKDAVTAISIVALGTSLPDTFASKVAAVQDSTADAAIGNVTGSNAVNVFLGIGIAWAIAALYHAWNGTVFRVHAGTLASSVTLFLLGSLVCFSVLQYRRYNKKIRGELGGPKTPKTIAAVIFVIVWLIYLIISTLVAYCVIPGF